MSYFIQWVIICYYLLLDAQTVSNLASENPFKLAWSSLHVPIIFWTLSCCLLQQNVPGSCSTFPAPTPDWAISTRSPGSWKLNQLHRSQDMSAKQAYGYWGVPASRPICIPTHTYSFTTIFISISTYANCSGVDPGTFPSNPTLQGSFWLLPFHFPNCVKPGFHYPYIFTYLTGTPT